MTTDWATLSHAYGGAGDVPDMLTALRKGDAEQAAHDLWTSVLHQGSLYDATAPAVAEICTVLKNRSTARVELAAWLLASAVAAALAHEPGDPHLRTPGQSLAAALVLRPDALDEEDMALRADALCRMVTRLPDRSEQACAVLAAEPDTVAALAGRLRAWRDGDELFDALGTMESAGFTDVAIKARIAVLLG
ncbi:hypothetical protein [Labedaea rhizosphaerae]|uniref:HEAT repeat protein n=1 Tax=Labedaea rhizosphaerae TaxID=598644 RepID=A0A4R6SMI4_LABRH|nr:hypothetical protein [Labedaea rhizosphaerae]TDQ04770.1 hypothetical protein EV186_101727 [Labedaea rhizosphaerae]